MIQRPNSIGELAIWVVVAAAIAALVFIALQQFGIAVPLWAVNVFWVLVVATVIVLAIKWLMSVKNE